MKARSRLKTHSGQMIIETILVMTVLLSIVLALRSTLQSSEAFKNLVQGPWQFLSGMMIAGDWSPPATAIERHPALGQNHGSVRGADPQ